MRNEQVLRAALILAACAAWCQAKPPEGEPVEFKAYDDLMLQADYYPPASTKEAAPAVILLHMYRHDRTSWQPLIAPLHEAGFAVLALDLRGHGADAPTELRRRVERRDSTIFEEMFYDVRGAYDWLAARDEVDRSRFALVGASVGCSVALRYANADRSVDAIVCLTPGLLYLGLDSKADAREIQGRHVLLLATENEREACDALAQTIAGAEQKVFDQAAAHGTQMFGQIPNIEARIADYLRQHVGKPTAHPVYASINSKVYHEPDAEWVAIIKPSNLRKFSSADEARARGLRASKTKGPIRNRP